MSHHLSGSRYHLAVGALEDPPQGCVYWARPEIDLPVQEVGRAGKIGNASHAHVAAYAQGRTPPEPETEEEWEALPIGRRVVAWLDDVGIPTAVEIAIAYDTATDTARRIEVGWHRDYADLRPTEIPTTLDFVWVTDDAVEVVDLKAGKRQNAHKEQLHIQGLASARLFGRPLARVAFTFARQTKCGRDPWEEMDADRLEGEAWRAAAVMRRLPVAQPQPGNWCWRCPLGRANCSAWALGPHAPIERDFL